MKTLNIATTGAGAMARTHAYSAANLRYFYADLPFEARLHTLCTRSPEKAERAASTLGYANHTTDEAEIMANPDIDIIDICTPNNCHFETIKAALAHGKHIYCEKPLVISSAQAAQLRPLMAKHPECICGVVFHNRFFPAVMRAKQLIESGQLGRILSFRFAYLHSSNLDTAKPAGWKQNKDVCGAGVLFDLGSHVLDLLVHLCGGIADVQSSSQIAFPERAGADGAVWQTNAEEAIYITAKLGSGAVGTVEASKIALGTNDELTFRIWGTDGAVKFDLMQPNYLEFFDGKDGAGTLGGDRGFKRIECVGRYDAPAGAFPSPKAPVGWLRAHMHSFYNFLDCVNRGVQPSPGFADGMYVQDVMERILAGTKW